MFESNFPVDKITSGYGVLWNAFKRLAAKASAAREDCPVFGHGERASTNSTLSSERLACDAPGLFRDAMHASSCSCGICAAAVMRLAPSASAQTLKVVMHSDVKALDPIWSGAYITRNHGYMLYDTLFAIDEKLAGEAADGRQAGAESRRRPHLDLHPARRPRVARRRAGDGGGLRRLAQALVGARFDGPEARARRSQEYKVVDAKTFQIVLKEKFGPLLEAIGKPSVVVPFMMPKRVAETDPFKQIDDYIGSGPFIFKKDEWKPGEKTVYVKNPKYKPRSEPTSGLAGGKVVDARPRRMGLDPRHRDAAQRPAEGRDRYARERHLRLICRSLEKDKDIRVITSTHVQPVRLPHELADPALQQREDPAGGRLWRWRRRSSCRPMSATSASTGPARRCSPATRRSRATAGMDDMIERQRRQGARDAEGGGLRRHGRRRCRSPPTSASSSSCRSVAKAQLEKAGFKVEVQPTDWTSMVTRLTTKKGPPSEGGWNAFGTELVAGRHPRPADDALSRRDLRQGARPAGRATRRWRSCATSTLQANTRGREEGGRRRGAAPRRADRDPRAARRMVRRLGACAANIDHAAGAAAGHRVLGHQQEVAVARPRPFRRRGRLCLRPPSARRSRRAGPSPRRARDRVRSASR